MGRIKEAYRAFLVRRASAHQRADNGVKRGVGALVRSFFSVHSYAPEEPVDSKSMRKTIFTLAWPCVAELVLASTCSAVDQIMVGRLGVAQLAAVGLTQQPRMLMLTAFFALNMGVTALISRFRGQNDQKMANAVLKNGLLISLLLGVVFMALGLALNRPLMLFMGANEDTLGYSTSYFAILTMGFLFNALSTTITAALRGVGDTRSSMIMNITANIVNVIFNYLLIYGMFGFPRLEVAGAAIATVIGFSVAFAFGMYMLLSKRRFIFIDKPREFRPDAEIIKRVARIGGPSVLEQLALRVGLILFTQAASGLGTAVFAGHQICGNMLNFTVMNGQAFGIAATTMVGQSLGRGRPGMAQAYTKTARRMGMCVSAVMAALFILLGKQWALLFTDDLSVAEMCVLPMIAVGCMQPFQSSNQITSGALKGAGDTRFPAISTLIGILGLRPILSYGLAYGAGLGLLGIWLGQVCDQALRAALNLMRFRTGKWAAMKV